jgi:two-component system sensor histidine kinase KdpD
MVLFLYAAQETGYTSNHLAFLQGLAGQISLALGLLYAKQSEQVAMQQAERENIHNALLSSLSHDFRTPLTTIMGAASSLRHQQADLSMIQQQSLYALIEDEAIAMLDDADNILSLTRVEALGRLALHADWQSLEELIGVVLSRCRQRYPKQRFEVYCAAALPLIFVDAKLIIQAMMNLIENAVKFDLSGFAINITVQTTDTNSIMMMVHRRFRWV